MEDILVDVVLIELSRDDRPHLRRKLDLFVVLLRSMAPGLELRVTQLQPLDLLARLVPFLAQLLVLLDLSLVGVGALPPSLLLFDDGAWSLALRRLVSVALSVPSMPSSLAPLGKNAS